MKRTAEIKRELVRLRADSHPAEYFDELRRIVVLHTCLPQTMKQLLSELRAAWPESFHEAVSGTTLPARIRQQEAMVGAFLASTQRQEEWCLEHDLEPKKLQRALKRYRENSEFRSRADEWADLFRTI